MAQAAGLSYSTARTTWVSSTSYMIVDVYTLVPGPDGVPTPSPVSEATWTFENSAPTSSSSASLSSSTTLPSSTTLSSLTTLSTLTAPLSPATSLSLDTTALATPTPFTSMSIPAIYQTPTGDASVSTPVPTSHTAVESPGLGGGAVAGVAIATALVGGLLGVVAGLFLAKRRKKHEPLPEYVACLDREKAPSPTNTLELDQFLLEPKPEATIASELLSLGHIIQRHAEKHYHLHPVQLESNQLRQPLSDLGIERGSAPAIARIASLALEPRTRLSAIRYVIAKAAFESTVIGGSTCVSLLPPVVSGMSPIVPFIGGDEVTELAITRWRQLSAFLLHPNRSQRAPLEPSEDISTQQAQQLTVALIRFLQPFISSDREERYEQENHLREVIAECATFGYVIFSQPSEYRFRFESNGGLNTIVVCPGLDKVISEGGRRYMPPLPQVAAPVVESI